jgi:hypothetical protein
MDGWLFKKVWALLEMPILKMAKIRVKARLFGCIFFISLN